MGPPWRRTIPQGGQWAWLGLQTRCGFTLCIRDNRGRTRPRLWPLSSPILHSRSAGGPLLKYGLRSACRCRYGNTFGFKICA